MKKLKLGHKPSLLLVLLFGLISAILNGMAIYSLRFITDYGLAKNMEGMLGVAKNLIIILIVISLVEIVNVNVKALYLRKSLILMKTTYINALMDHDITQVQKDKVSKYRSNLINDFDRYEERYLKPLLMVIRMLFQFVVALFLMGLIDLRLILVAILMLVIFGVISSKSSKPIKKKEEVKTESLESYTAYVEESLDGFEIVKQHQLEEQRELEFIKHAQKVQDDNYEVDVKHTHIEALNTTVQYGVLFIAIIGGLIFAHTYGVKMGDIVVIASSFGNILWPIQQLSPVIISMSSIAVLLDTFDYNLKHDDVTREYKIDDFNTISFDHSDLGYDDYENPVLFDVDIEINKHEKVLIVGASGAGKSTILKTLRQSIKPKNKTVLLDGKDIFKIDANDYYRLFSTIDQIGFIFSGTIKENITLFRDFDDHKINEVMKQVGLEELDVNEMLKNDGANLSGGQRARLLLARALCLDSSVILCDEILASLPSEIAQDIEYDILKQDSTIVNVSHIIFKEHLELYDKIYLVEDNTTRLVKSVDEVWERMVLS